MLLLESGAFIEALDNEHYTPLHRASFSGHASVVSGLLRHGAQIEARTRRVSDSRAFDQVRKRTEKMWPKRASTSGYIALHLAASCGNAEVVRILLDNEAVFNSDSVDGTLRPMAAGHPDVITLLNTAQSNHDEGIGSTPPPDLRVLSSRMVSEKALSPRGEAVVLGSVAVSEGNGYPDDG